MIRKMIFSTALLAVMTIAMSAQAQDAAKKRPGLSKDIVTIEISSVNKNDAQAKQIIAERRRIVPVNFQWLCGSQGNAKLVELEAILDTVNTDGKKSHVTKRLLDWTVNKPINSVIDLPMDEGVFARDFTLTLKGKFKRGLVDELVAVSAVKSGRFALPLRK